MDAQTFTAAEDAVLAYYQGSNYSLKRLKVVRYTMKTINLMVMDAGIEFDADFLAKARQFREASEDYWISFTHVVGMLRLAIEGKELGCKTFSQQKQDGMPVTQEFFNILAVYLEFQRKLGKAERTVANERNSNSRLLCHLEQIGITRFKDIQITDLQGYLSGHIPSLARSTAQATIYRNRRFARFLVRNGYASTNLLPVFDYRVAIPKHIVTTLTEGQANQIYSTPRAKTTMEARSHAVLLCCLVLGLRRSDAYKLKLSEIDWKHEKVHIIQKKTRVPLTLPLPKNVGSAIATYIMHFRPAVSSEYVFLATRAPYSRIVGNSTALRDCLADNQDQLTCGGYHILRRTCASYLLANGTDTHCIMNLLGQTSLDSLDCYLCLDEPNMALSPLDTSSLGLPEVLI